MNLEQFLSERLTTEQMEVLNQKAREGKEDNKVIITIPKELVDMINKEANGKKILTDNIIRFMRSLKSDLEA